MHVPDTTAPRLAAAAAAFRHFFREVGDAFLEREALLGQLELALLAREHVLVIGPPGTGKSAVAAAVLGRIVDGRTGAPSLYARQLTETTVAADLLGPVDFKVLTETGRTEHLTDEGMLGAAHVFLDEVFDGRDMLLRALLNALNERELKHGRKVTPGRTACAVMTSNRTLTEVVARAPELLVAFADRLSFVCYVPHGFARPQSRGAMLERAVHDQRPQLRAPLTLQEVEVLREAVAQVRVPPPVLEALELLGERVDRALAQHAQATADYVRTRTLSQRGLVKALWVLKAAVVRDRIWTRPDRPLEASLEDLPSLGLFFATGGPPSDALEVLLAGVADPQERAQLEAVRAEAGLFAEALAATRREVARSHQREAEGLALTEELAAVEGLRRAPQPAAAGAVLRSLHRKLRPGPRHAEHRETLLAAARSALAVARECVARAPAAPGEAGERQGTWQVAAAALGLCDEVPALREELPPVAEACAGAVRQLHARIAMAAEAGGTDGRGLAGTGAREAAALDAVAALAAELAAELGEAEPVVARLTLAAPATAAALAGDAVRTRGHAAQVLRRRATLLLRAWAPGTQGRKVLSEAARALAALEAALLQLEPGQQGLRQELLGPEGAAFARTALAQTPFARVGEYARAVQEVAEALRAEGLAPAAALAPCAAVVGERLLQHARGLAPPAAPPRPTAAGALGGEAYGTYRERLARGAPDGEVVALQQLEAQLPGGASSLPAGLREAVARAELASLDARARYLREWLGLLLAALPVQEGPPGRQEAERGLDALVRSRLPYLAIREGELPRLAALLAVLAREGGAVGEEVRRVERQVQEVGDTLAATSQLLLDARTAR